MVEETSTWHNITTAGTTTNWNRRDIRKDITILGWMIDWEFTIGWFGYLVMYLGILSCFSFEKCICGFEYYASYIHILKGHGWIMSNYSQILLLYSFALTSRNILTQMFFIVMEEKVICNLIYNTERILWLCYDDVA